MSDIKVIEGLEPIEVMKRVLAGEELAAKHGDTWGRSWSDDGIEFRHMCQLIANGREIAIIDTSTPEIDWNKVKWQFFSLYGGIQLLIDGEPMDDEQEWGLHDNVTFAESPFYYWVGGEQPVPDNVEVEVIRREGGSEIYAAGQIRTWSNDRLHRQDRYDIIAFKLTGGVS